MAIFEGFAQTPKLNFISQKSSFFEPPSTRNIHQNRMCTENLRRNFVCTQYIKEKMILRASSLAIYVICDDFRTQVGVEPIYTAFITKSSMR